MATATGSITKVSDDYVEFAFEQTSACSACRLKAVCGQSMLARGAESKMARVQVPVECPGDFNEQQTAELHVDDKAISVSVLVGYLLPIVGLVIGAAAGDHWFSTDAGSAALAAVGFGGGIAGIKLFSRRHKNTRWMQPSLINTQGALKHTGTSNAQASGE